MAILVEIWVVLKVDEGFGIWQIYDWGIILLDLAIGKYVRLMSTYFQEKKKLTFNI